jgi:hypothetical protein
MLRACPCLASEIAAGARSIGCTAWRLNSKPCWTRGRAKGLSITQLKSAERRTLPIVRALTCFYPAVYRRLSGARWCRCWVRLPGNRDGWKLSMFEKFSEPRESTERHTGEAADGCDFYFLSQPR